MADFEKPSLLPPALAVDLSMRALEVLIARLVELDLAPTLVYDFEHVTESALPHLGEQFHVMGAEGWRLATTPEQRRALLARAVALHRHKGTPWSIREALKSVGRDDMGREALRDGLKKISFANSADKYSADSAISFVSGELVIDHDPDCNVDYVSERSEVVRKVLEKGL